MPLTEIRPKPIEKTSPALAGKSSLHDPLAFELLEPAADRPGRHAETGGQEPLRPPKSIDAGPHETDEGVFVRLPLEQIRQVRLLLAAAYGQTSSLGCAGLGLATRYGQIAPLLLGVRPAGQKPGRVPWGLFFLPFQWDIHNLLFLKFETLLLNK